MVGTDLELDFMLNRACRVCWQSTSTGWGYTPSHPDPCSVDGNATCNLYLRVVGIEKAIEAAQKTLLDLVNEHKALMIEVNDYHDPMHKLPAELVSQIFGFCFPRPPSNAKSIPSAYYLEDFPLVLGHVCRRWRQIAWATPHLWSTIHFYSVPGYDYKVSPVISKWIDCSGTLPLTIQVTMQESQMAGDDEMTRVIRDLSHRWHNLDLSITRRAAQHIFADGYVAPPGPLGFLTICIKDIEQYYYSGKEYPMCSLPDAWWVQFSGTGFPISRDRSSLPGAKSLELYRVESKVVARFLNHARNIQTLDIGKCSGSDDPEMNLPTPIVLPHLTSINISGDLGRPWRGWNSNNFDSAAFPSLETLKLSTVPPDAWTRSFLSQSPQLKELEFTGFLTKYDGGRRRRDMARRHFQLFRQIETLRIKRPRDEAQDEAYPLVDDQFMECLGLRSYTPADSDTPLPFLPSLEHFFYQGSRFFSWNSLPRLFDLGAGKVQGCLYLRRLVMKIISKNPHDEAIFMDMTTAQALHELGQGVVSISVLSATGETVFEDLVESACRAVRPNEEVVDYGRVSHDSEEEQVDVTNEWAAVTDPDGGW